MKRAVALLALAAPLAGCGLFGDSYQRPALDMPLSFRGENAPANQQSFGDLGWWEVYRDPGLQELIKTALEQNYDVKIAAARVEEFRAQAGIARIGQLPQITAGADAEHSRISAIGRTPLPATTPAIGNDFSGEIDLSYEVDLWGRVSNLTRAARADLLATEFARDAVRTGLIADVATTYFNLLALDQQLAVTEQTVASRQKFLDLTKAQFERGVVSGLDVSRAEANLAAAQANIPDFRRQITQAEDQLQVLLGRNPAAVQRTTPVDALPAATPPVVPAGLPAALLERRPDVREAEYDLIAADARLKSVKASLIPIITLTGSIGSESAELSDFLSGPAKTWSIGVDIAASIINSTVNIKQVDVFSARQQQTQFQYQKTVLQALQEVADALAARKGYSDALRAQEAQVVALRSASERVLQRYAAGYSSYFEVISADQDLYSAELLRVLAYRDALTAGVQLYKALGGGWQAAADSPSPAADAPTGSGKPAVPQ
ncbi:MAG TPA: efflux transporter outer membrane subunit [Burkholderiales bacterium]|nr:efflux transporter outer membrane subunit [Burkholderiales bacterium]